MIPFVRLKSVLTHHQNQDSNFSSRDMQPGRLGLLGPETRPTGDDTTWEGARDYEPDLRSNHLKRPDPHGDSDPVPFTLKMVDWPQRSKSHGSY